MSRIVAILLAASLSACGMKGPLELPPGPPPEPLLGGAPSPLQHKQRAKPAPKDVKDGSTDTSTPQ